MRREPAVSTDMGRPAVLEAGARRNHSQNAVSELRLRLRHIRSREKPLSTEERLIEQTPLRSRFALGGICTCHILLTSREGRHPQTAFKAARRGIQTVHLPEPHLATIKLISKVGYTVSLIALVAAFVILASIKRLRCPRNSLHMHLFLSFILRALAFLLKDALFIAGVGLSGNVDFNKEVSTLTLSDR
ncbi:hypothetical protein HPB48_019663 [Haemaphysalis longicornis]|uniref:G-protein coupled receptors family 2 profile 2 domain-containing protein n=1 Tax=Haemaphysalis longicornis TaxID=44386 RepID=A0A9J6G2N8_HAELO|nr:hypothetical protein HPB48_019663 [Haemaphysalis longicornis]